jgi:predicted transcriptional regulator
MSDKQAAMEVMDSLPDEISFNEILDELSLLAAIRQGQEDIKAGRVFSHEEAIQQAREAIQRATQCNSK